MPPRKRQQNNAMLYTLIAFVGLFTIAATFAVIYYVKAEDYRTKETALRRDIGELANNQERQRLVTIVGTRQPGKTWLATMVEHFDKAIRLVTGTIPQDAPAEIKFKNVSAEVRNTLMMVHKYIALTGTDPNSTGLTRVIADLKAALDNATAAGLAQQDRYADLDQRYNDAMAATLEKEQILVAQKDILQQMVNQAQQDYDEIRVRLQESTDQRVQDYLTQLQEEQTNFDRLNQELLKTQAQLDLTEEKMERAQQEVSMTKPPPDSNVPAFIADGKVILVDFQTKLVHINKGSNDHVYRGLTFAVHDKYAPIPKDGKGKAEIEVFDVDKTFSAARIITSNRKRPIMEGDIIANLIWDSSRKNVFVIAGQFDLDNSGGLDRDAHVKIKALIEKWGGRVDDAVSVDTDFLVLGKMPLVLRKPTFEELEIDPRAMDKYEASQRLRNRYDQLQAQAQALWIPVFTYDRFLYFIGYKGQVTRAGAF